MNIYFNTSNSYWLLLLIILISAVYTWLFYRSDRQKSHFNAAWLIILSSLRFLAVFIIGFLLIKPGLEFIEQIEDKPIAIFIQDNSQSIASGFSNTEDKLRYQSDYQKIIDEVSKDYLIHEFSVAQQLKEVSQDRITFDEKSSNLSLVAEKIPYLFDGRNVAAVVYATDGIYNQGNNPGYQFANFPFPLYTIGLGDPQIYPDIQINRLITNRLAFTGNEFPLEVEIKGKAVPAGNYQLTVQLNGEQQSMYSFSPGSTDFIHQAKFSLVAGSPGIAELKVLVSKINAEKNIQNNEASVLIEVLDKKQKVLIVANSPHPDISAMKDALEAGRQVEVDVKMAASAIENLAAYNLVIYHQLPSLSNGIPALLQETYRLHLPALFVVGVQTDLQKLNKAGYGNLYSLSNPLSEFAQGYLAGDFSLFTPEESLGRQVAQWPPLTVPFSRLNKLPEQAVLLYQKIKSVATEIPLIAFYSFPEQKIGIISGEGVWRWNLANYQLEENHHTFQYLMNQLVQYLALKVQKERLKIDFRPVCQEDEPVLFNAELYNPSYEKIFTQEIKLSVQNDKNEEFDYVFGLKDDAYFLDAGSLPQGKYTFRASAVVDGTEISKSGSFSIARKELESLNLQADHELLKLLATEHAGKFYLPENMLQLTGDLDKLKEKSVVIREEKTKRDFIELKFVLLLLVLLFAVEWFARKYHGAY